MSKAIALLACCLLAAPALLHFNGAQSLLSAALGPREPARFTPDGAVACFTAPAHDLPPLDLSDMRLWNYKGKWHASEWENAFSFIPWRHDHVRRMPNGDVAMTLDAQGAPELKSEAGIPMADRGLWEVEATLPKMRDGLVVAPLWLYNQAHKEELDFEFAGARGLDVSIHAYPGGVHHKQTVRLFENTDFSGCTVRLGIEADIPAGWARMHVNGVPVHEFRRDELGYFVTQEARPIIEMWAARTNHPGFVAWAGKWQGLAPGEKLDLVIHGYRYTPPPEPPVQRP